MEERSVFKELLHELPILEEEVFSYADLMGKWTQYFNSLIQKDFPKLVSLLYRIDISENKLKLKLNQKPNEDAGKIIASLVCERLLQKISSREESRSKPDVASDDPDLEAW